jgi:hypothetical protein
MRPKLKIGPLISLQDARSCAAVGFDVISFSLARGSFRKLSASTVWNMIQWLDGPAICLELNADSLEELTEARKQFEPAWIEADWTERNAEWPAGFPLLLTASLQELTPADAAAWLNTRPNSYLQLSLPEATLPAAWHALLPRLFLHLPEPALAGNRFFLPGISPAGWALSTEWEEAPGELDYQAIDDALEQLPLHA